MAFMSITLRGWRQNEFNPSTDVEASDLIFADLACLVRQMQNFKLSCEQLRLMEPLIATLLNSSNFC